MTGRGQGLSLAQVASLTGGRVVGDPQRRIQRLAPLDKAGSEDLSMLTHPRYRSAATGSAAALLVKEGLEVEGRDLVVVGDPHLALAVLLPRLVSLPPPPAQGISDRALIASSAKVGEGAAIGPFAVIEPECTIGENACIGAGAWIGPGCEIGPAAVIHPNVTVYAGCRLGSRVVVHAGSVIGSDGFGYAVKDGIHQKIPQVGSVVIEDDVEVGACVTIDRGSIGDTVIGRGTKIDNLVQIGHNVKIGPGCLIVAQTGISGSTRIGAGSVFAGQSGAAGHLSIGPGAVVASKSAVYEDLGERAFVAGIPAIEHRRWKRAQAIFGKLPELLSRVRALEERRRKRT